MNYFLINLLWCKQNFSSKFLPLLFYLVFFRSFLQLMEHFRNLQRLLNRSLISSSEFIPRGQHCDLASEIYQGNLSVLWLILLNHISKDTCNLMGGKAATTICGQPGGKISGLCLSWWYDLYMRLQALHSNVYELCWPRARCGTHCPRS